MLTYGTGAYLYRQVMNTTTPKKKQQWQVLYHQDCIGEVKSGGIPCNIIHAHEENFDHLSQAQDYMRKNPMPPEDQETHNGDYDLPLQEGDVLLSAVQVRGPVRCELKPQLNSV